MSLGDALGQGLENFSVKGHRVDILNIVSQGAKLSNYFY